MILVENFPFKLPCVLTSSSPGETFSLGEGLAPLLEKGDVVALRGPLGAGKTCFVKGIALGLGISEEVTSPTYTIISEYEGKVPVYHIDAYRLGGEEDFISLGGEEIIFGEGISLIEWSERIPGFILSGAYKVDIAIIEGDTRRISIYRSESPQGEP